MSEAASRSETVDADSGADPVADGSADPCANEAVVRVLMFAHYRELTGESSIRVVLPSGATVGDLVDQLRGDPRFRAALPADPAVAVNQEYASSHTPLTRGDEVALIPPVSGG